MAERNQLNRSQIFIISEDWYFVSHHFHLAIAAIGMGYHVGLLSRFTNHRDIIINSGVQFFDWFMNRGPNNPLQEICSVLGKVREEVLN